MTSADDPYNLQRFVVAQNSWFGQVCTELHAGEKRSHWMWFIFPQIRGLGHSATSRMLAVSSRQEAEAYLKHPILGPRLKQCTSLVNLLEGRSVRQIFGPDEVKFRSSMTLFASTTTPDNQIFRDALQKYFAGEPDRRTLERI